MLRIAALCLVFCAATVRAATPCAASYEHATSTTLAARLGQGLERKLVTKVENAWRIFSSGKKNGRKVALQQLGGALGLLERNSTKQLPEDVRAPVREAIDAFRRCIEGVEIATASATIRVKRPDASVAPGAIIRVNDEEVGITGADGALTVTLPAGGARVSAIRYMGEQGDAYLTLAPGTVGSVDILLVDREPQEQSKLVVAEAVDGIFPSTATTFTLQFIDPTGAIVPLADIDNIQLRKPDGSGWTYWSDDFEVTSDGSLRARDAAAWGGTLRSQRSALNLTVQAQDRRGPS